MNASRPNPEGVILICVLTCLLVAVSLAALSIQMALKARLESRVSLQLLQTESLVDAGRSRAIAQLQKSADYRGETWHPASSRTGLAAAVVEIAVQPDAAQSHEQETPELTTPSTLQITVTAQLESTTSAAPPTQRTQSFTIELSQLLPAE